MNIGIKSTSRRLSQSLFRKVYRNYQQQKLHIYEGGRNSISGIRATLFGATGHVGSIVGSKLGYISSDLVFPVTSLFHGNDEMKELKLCANLGQSWIVKNMDFDDFKLIQRVTSQSNVIVNMCGPRKMIKNKADFEEVNIEIPRRIAKAARLNPDIIRFIHFSAAGAAPDSPSLDLQTKYFGEQAVLEEFPNATILRPTQMYGMNDQFVKRFYQTVETWWDMIPVFNDCTQLRQPISSNDVAQCVLNALKLHETCGNIYELGGPAVYTQRELYEIMINFLNRKIHLQKFHGDIAKKVAQLIPNWKYFNLDDLIKDDLDLIVNPEARSIEELYVDPISFPLAAEHLLSPHAQRDIVTHEYEEA